MVFNEDSRVKIPCILHLTRLGYSYLSLKSARWDEATNIFEDIFCASVARINPHLNSNDIKQLLVDTKLTLDNEDLGKTFYEKLTTKSGTRLIDFTDFSNNSLHLVTELPYKNDEDEFRPDITLLINGLPLVFIEVKKPHNREGMLAERQRIISRFENKRFRRFVNITQFMLFSNNMEYDSASSQPIEGAFYATSAYHSPKFNYFREEEQDFATLHAEDDKLENIILQDTNYTAIKHSPEFLLNKCPNTPTHRLCTSLCSPQRLAFVLQYALTYVREYSQGQGGLQKHIMRYPQLFATKAIERTLAAGTKKGIIWHTQGSGKTALAYYNTRFLRDYYQLQGIIPKFYFIVDRLDLLTQAQREFTARGLTVYTVDSREAFAKDIKSTKAVHNDSGKPEITVVNIQKFKDDPSVMSTSDYNTSIQRIYFLDEVHRSYNPKGSFLANLSQSDTHAVKIGLTGTPLLGTDYSSRTVFGDYIHKYYYNASIADGYTLRLIREEIATNYKMALQEALKALEIAQGSFDRTSIYAHKNFVASMLAYIVEDFAKSRITLNDPSVGGMVICDSAEQAKMLHTLFIEYVEKNPNVPIQSAALILHDVGSKQERKDWVEDFKAGKIDMLFVFNMLLTGFDAPRLKKLYLGRIIRKHNLLQALTRVNRPYKNFRYGYIVDFADIRQEFEATNEAYFKELQEELGDEIESYSKLFKTQEEIAKEIADIKDILFSFDTSNAEIFSQQIGEIQDRKQVLALKKALGNARDLYNIIRLQGDFDFLQDLDFQKLNLLYREACNHLEMLNLKERLEQAEDTESLLNAALEDIVFLFSKIGEEELVLADKLKDALRRTREAFAMNFDQKDVQYITLKEELERLFKKKKLSEVNHDDMVDNIDALKALHAKIQELNRKNDILRHKYLGDSKFTRIHKRLMEQGQTGGSLDAGSGERVLFETLMHIKNDADAIILQNAQLLDNEEYFTRYMQPFVINALQKQQHMKITPPTVRALNGLIVAEYQREYTGASTW